MIVTGNTIYNHFSHPCSYRVFLDLFGDRRERSIPSATGRYLMERGNRHEAQVFADLKSRFPDDCIEIARDPSLDHETDILRRIEATEKAMRAGHRFIMHGFLTTEPAEVQHFRPGQEPIASELVYRGETDLLERIDGFKTKFGDYGYQVGDVKSSRHARFGQRMQVAFYSAILALRQAAIPEHGFIITGESRREDFEIEDLSWTLRHFLEEEIHEFLDEKNVFFHLEPSCRYCHWREHCEAKASAEDDLSLIPGCRRPEKRALIAAGIPNRKTLSRADEKELRQLGRAWGRSMDGYRDLKKRAAAQEFGMPLVRQEPRQAEPASSMQTPSLFRHRGPVILVDSIPDPFHGDEAILGMISFEPREREIHWDARFVHSRKPEHPEFILRSLFKEIAQTNKLLRREMRRVLLVFLDGRLPYRLKRQAAEAGARHRSAPASVERLVSDSVILSASAERTWHLPCEARDWNAIGKSFGKALDFKVSRPALEPGRLEEHLRLIDPEEGESRAQTLRQRLDNLAEDYAFDSQDLAQADAEIEAIAVREWRDGDLDDWRLLLEVSLAERLQSGAQVLRHLVGMIR